VTAVEAEVGALAGGPAVVVETSDRLEVPIYLDENDIVQVGLGQPAAVTLDAYRDLEVAGEVVRVAPTADVLSGVVLYPVTVALEPLEVPVRLGMGADVEILTADVEGALIIPRHAVQYVGGQAIVLRQLRDGETPDSVSRPLPGMGDAVEGQGDGSASLPQLPEGTNSAQLPGNGFVPVRVELGPQTATEVVVLSGLEEGDVVSVANLSALGGNAGLGTFGGMRGGGFGAFQP
jgi:multidrug efflux pump subunit AcrA (membrane-fusion protein)